jgi:hypothetical protein
MAALYNHFLALGAVQEVGYFLNSHRNFMVFLRKTMKLQHLFQCPKKLSNFSDTANLNNAGL